MVVGVTNSPTATARTTPPGTPTAAEWKCAAVIAPDRPSMVMRKASPAGVRTKFPVPIAAVATDGRSCAPVKLAVKLAVAVAVGSMGTSWARISPPGLATVLRLR